MLTLLEKGYDLDDFVAWTKNDDGDASDQNDCLSDDDLSSCVMMPTCAFVQEISCGDGDGVLESYVSSASSLAEARIFMEREKAA